MLNTTVCIDKWYSGASSVPEAHSTLTTMVQGNHVVKLFLKLNNPCCEHSFYVFNQRQLNQELSHHVTFNSCLPYANNYVHHMAAYE